MWDTCERKDARVQEVADRLGVTCQPPTSPDKVAGASGAACRTVPPRQRLCALQDCRQRTYSRSLPSAGKRGFSLDFKTVVSIRDLGLSWCAKNVSHWLLKAFHVSGMRPATENSLPVCCGLFHGLIGYCGKAWNGEAAMGYVRNSACWENLGVVWRRQSGTPDEHSYPLISW